MKTKILSLFTIILSIFNICFATDNKNIVLDLTGNTAVETNQKTVELILSLGEFTGIEEGIVLGFEGKLQYDKNMFTLVTIEGLNQWTVEYAETTSNFIGDTIEAKSNTDIAKITLTLKDNLKAGTTGKVTLNNILLTDEINDFTFNKEATITVFEKEQTPEIQTPEEQTPAPAPTTPSEDETQNDLNTGTTENNKANTTQEQDTSSNTTTTPNRNETQNVLGTGVTGNNKTNTTQEQNTSKNTSKNTTTDTIKKTNTTKTEEDLPKAGSHKFIIILIIALIIAVFGFVIYRMKNR